MTITHVQGKANSDASATTTLTVTFASAVTTGDLVCGLVSLPDSSGGGGTLTSVKDNASPVNTYTILDSADQTTDHQIVYSFYLANVAGGPTVLTATFSGSFTQTTLVADEFSGIATSSALDQHTKQLQTAVSTGAGAISSGSVTTTAAGDLIYGATMQTSFDGESPQSAGVGSGFTFGESDTAKQTSSEYQVQASAGAIAATFTAPSSGFDYATFVMAFFAGGGSPPVFSNNIFTGQTAAVGEWPVGGSPIGAGFPAVSFFTETFTFVAKATAQVVKQANITRIGNVIATSPIIKQACKYLTETATAIAILGKRTVSTSRVGNVLATVPTVLKNITTQPFVATVKALFNPFKQANKTFNQTVIATVSNIQKQVSKTLTGVGTAIATLGQHIVSISRVGNVIATVPTVLKNITTQPFIFNVAASVPTVQKFINKTAYIFKVLITVPVVTIQSISLRTFTFVVDAFSQIQKTPLLTRVGNVIASVPTVLKNITTQPFVFTAIATAEITKHVTKTFTQTVSAITLFSRSLASNRTFIFVTDALAQIQKTSLLTRLTNVGVKLLQSKVVEPVRSFIVAAIAVLGKRSIVTAPMVFVANAQATVTKFVTLIPMTFNVIVTFLQFNTPILIFVATFVVSTTAALANRQVSAIRSVIALAQTHIPLKAITTQPITFVVDALASITRQFGIKRVFPVIAKASFSFIELIILSLTFVATATTAIINRSLTKAPIVSTAIAAMDIQKSISKTALEFISVATFNIRKQANKFFVVTVIALASITKQVLASRTFQVIASLSTTKELGKFVFVTVTNLAMIVKHIAHQQTALVQVNTLVNRAMTHTIVTVAKALFNPFKDTLKTFTGNVAITTRKSIQAIKLGTFVVVSMVGYQRLITAHLSWVITASAAIHKQINKTLLETVKATALFAFNLPTNVRLMFTVTITAASRTWFNIEVIKHHFTKVTNAVVGGTFTAANSVIGIASKAGQAVQSGYTSVVNFISSSFRKN